MKKFTALFLSLMLVFSLAACGNTQNESDRTTSGSTAESQEPESSTQPGKNPQRRIRRETLNP